MRFESIQATERITGLSERDGRASRRLPTARASFGV